MKSCGGPWPVCELVLVSYVDAVVAATMMPVLLFVLDVCMLRECECESDRGGVIGITAWHEYVGGTRGSGFVFNAADVLGMRVVHGIK